MLLLYGHGVARPIPQHRDKPLRFQPAVKMVAREAIATVGGGAGSQGIKCDESNRLSPGGPDPQHHSSNN